ATGDYRPITDWAEASRPVLALDPISHGLSKRPVEAFYAQGVRLIVEVTTRLGRRLRCTSDHPLLTVDGWVPIEELVPGARIAAPRALPYFGSDSMAEAEVKLIAYVLSDGAAHSSVNVTTALPEVVDDLRSIATRFGMTLRTFKKRDNRAATYAFVYPRGARAEVRVQVRDALRRMQAAVGITWGEWARRAAIDYWTLRVWRNGFAVPSEAELRLLADAVGMPLSELAPEARSLAEKTTPVARLLERVGLRHVNARQKFVPDCIFRLPKEQLAIFLRTLFTCDGSVYVAQDRLPGLSYSTISERLAHDLQHLLLRFGFVAKLRTKPMRVNGNPYTAYELQMLGIPQVKRFLREIGIWGREEAKAKIGAMPVPTIPSTHFNTVPTGKRFWTHLHEVSEGASFKAMSRAAGVAVHPGRIDRPLARSTVTAIANAYQSPYLRALADGDVYWDEIESITPSGEAEVYDLTVPELENFVANDLIIHNSSLLLQAAGDIALTSPSPVLYVTAEESPQQVKLRAERLGISTERLLLLPETDSEAVVETAERIKPALVVVDSIQTVASPQIASAPGSISQVRDATLRLMQLAKSQAIPVFLIGHVTKEGTVAGPRALEHMVDAVLYLEGERFHTYRLLRGVKNRFGATNEVGVFEMRSEGMVDVENPSALFLAERAEHATGSAVTVSLEGTRPLLVEVQALVSTTVFGTPRVTTNGVEQSRTLMLLAVLTKRVGLALGNQDVYINVAGGFSLGEPAVDLGVAAAVASSFRERRIAPEIALIGEVGLGGELRAVSRAEARIREAAKLGFRRCVVPRSGVPSARDLASTSGGIELLRAATLAEALEIALDT
ncbi:MAG TPA: DNA repair protein RadA, partial [Ktedonobacterales bacterium]|nr:DNA repair protein RadA [Ktedonobacterales bacterium]